MFKKNVVFICLFVFIISDLMGLFTEILASSINESQMFAVPPFDSVISSEASLVASTKKKKRRKKKKTDEVEEEVDSAELDFKSSDKKFSDLLMALDIVPLANYTMGKILIESMWNEKSSIGGNVVAFESGGGLGFSFNYFFMEKPTRLYFRTELDYLLHGISKKMGHNIGIIGIGGFRYEDNEGFHLGLGFGPSFGFSTISSTKYYIPHLSLGITFEFTVGWKIAFSDNSGE